MLVILKISGIWTSFLVDNFLCVNRFYFAIFFGTRFWHAFIYISLIFSFVFSVEKEVANGSHIIVNDDIAKAYENLKNIEEIGKQFVKARSHQQNDGKSDGLVNGNS